jgi:hypothetical protein
MIAQSRGQSSSRADIATDRVGANAVNESDFSSAPPADQDHWSQHSKSIKDHQDTYLLEAVAALGDLKTVSVILSEYNFLGLDGFAVEKTLLAACKAGKKAVVEGLVDWMVSEGLSLRRALEYVASHGQMTRWEQY